jgi:hypothetical protein
MKTKSLNKKQLEIIAKIKSDAWSEYSSPVKNLIDELFLCYYKSEDSQGYNREQREDTAYYIYLIKKTLDYLHALDKAGDMPISEGIESPQKNENECIDCIKKQAQIDYLKEQLAAVEKRHNELIVENWKLREESGDPREEAKIKILNV